MQRRHFIAAGAALTASAALPAWSRANSAAAGRAAVGTSAREGAVAETSAAGVSVDELPRLKGRLTLYLGRGEGGLYENVLKAIEARNPDLQLGVRRGPTAALANAIVAERRAGVKRTDLFWAVDAGAIGLVSEAVSPPPLPGDLIGQLKAGFRYQHWAPVSGRIRTLPFNPSRVQSALPTSIQAVPDSGLRLAWAPAYASFQSFVTAMRLLDGDEAAGAWLQAMDAVATAYAGELGVVMAVARGEADLGLANHYYTLRLKAGKPEASIDLAFTRRDAGCLLNASGIVALNRRGLAQDFTRYLLSREVQSYIAREAYEIPMIEGAPAPPGLALLERIEPPAVDLTRLADLRPTLSLMRRVGVL